MIGTIIANQYRVTSFIGSGGMAYVYRAKRLLDGQWVAIKVLKPEYEQDPEFISRFEREAKAASLLSHPNIMGLIESGKQDGKHYLVLELLHGITLKEYIRQSGQISLPKALNIALQICQALQCAHENGVVHRDIKPQNIMIDDNGKVKVADFGLAQAASSSTITIAGSNVLGSVQYFSPEMARGGVINCQSDLYSLGVVLFEMLTGQIPFDGETPVAVAMKHLSAPVIFPSDVEIPQAVRHIILKAMDKNLLTRYSDAQPMISDIKKAIWEPDGNFVDIDMGSKDAPTQVVSITEEPAHASEEEKRVVRLRIMRLVIGMVIIIGLFFILFLVASSIYQAQAQASAQSYLGMTQAQAIQAAQQNEQRLSFKQQYSTTVPEGAIIEQFPHPGDKLQRGDVVEVIISLGAEQFHMPILIGESYEQAFEILRDHELIIGQIYYEESDRPQGIVFQQFPEIYTLVTAGAVVDIYVSGQP